MKPVNYEQHSAVSGSTAAMLKCRGSWNRTVTEEKWTLNYKENLEDQAIHLIALIPCVCFLSISSNCHKKK